MSFFRKIKAGLVKAEITEFVGEEGNIFFNVDTGELRLSDGITPGGLPLGDGSGYILPTASTTTLGGVKVDGTTITINNGVISGFTGDYNDLANQPVIPFDISDLTDATGILTQTLFELDDVDINNIENNQIIVYNSTTGFFENRSVNTLFPVYTRLIDSETTEGITYFGEADPGSATNQAVWRIQRITYNSFAEVVEVKLAGTGVFDQAWNDRTSLIYI